MSLRHRTRLTEEPPQRSDDDIMARLLRFYFLIASTFATGVSITAYLNIPHPTSGWEKTLWAIIFIPPALPLPFVLTAWLLDYNDTSKHSQHLLSIVYQRLSWIAIFSGITGYTLCLTLHLTHTFINNNQHSTANTDPYIITLLLINVIYTTLLNRHLALPIVCAQTVLHCVTVLATTNATLTSITPRFLYLACLSMVFLGCGTAGIRGAQELLDSFRQTNETRLNSITKNSLNTENKRINALVHDSIISVIAVVGSNMKVPAETLKTSAQTAQETIRELSTEHVQPPFLTTPPQTQTLKNNTTPQTTETPSATPNETTRNTFVPPHIDTNKPITMVDFIRLLRGIASAHQISFSTRGIALKLLTSSTTRILVQLTKISDPTLPGHVAADLIYAAHECIRNIRRHAHATHASVVITHRPKQGYLSVIITDDGIGFDPNQREGGFGMQNSVKARIAQLDGKVTVKTALGQGTTVTLTVPTPTNLAEYRDTHTVFASERHHNWGTNTRNASTIFTEQFSSRNGRISLFIALVTIWTFTLIALPETPFWYFFIIMGAGFSLPFTRVLLDPTYTPSITDLIPFQIASAILPAINLLILPNMPAQGMIFSTAMLLLLQLWLVSKGRPIWAALSLALTVTSLQITETITTFPVGWHISLQNIVLFTLFCTPYAYLTYFYRGIQRQQDTQSILHTGMITAEHLNQLRATRSALIRIEADELLQNIADGMNPADLREAATVAEAQLRDSIAAPHLYVAPLRDVTRQARAQGMRIRLVDSSNGNTDLHTLIEAATNAIREAPHAATVTVRAEPAGRSTIGTILIHNGDKQEIFPITANQPGLNSREYYHRWNVERAQWDSHP